MDDTQDTATVPVDEVFASLWAPGRHSLCSQQIGMQFRVNGFFTDPRALLDAARALPADANVWWGVHGMNGVKLGRGGASDVTAVTVLAADYDWHDTEAHAGADLPDEPTLRAIVAGIAVVPTVIVNSGHGLQLFWKLEGPLDSRNGGKLSDGFFRWVEQTYEIHNDRTDLASILRVPSTFNNKTDPVAVEIESWDPTLVYDPRMIRDNFWLPEPEPTLAASPQASVLPLSSLDKPSRLLGSLPDSQQGLDVSHETSPLQWLNEQFDAQGALARMGWQPGRKHGEYTRPGKSVREGNSALLHEDGTFVVFSTTLDNSWLGLGKPGQGCLVFTPADLWMLEQGITDVRQASSVVRTQLMPQTSQRQLMPQQSPPARFTALAEPEAPAEVSVAAGTDLNDTSPGVALNLPPEFWAQRPWLQVVYDEAMSRLESPDAVLGCLVARFAAAIPPSYVIPAIVGAEATFDHLSVLVGESGAGKSSAMKIAKGLWPGPPYPGIVWDLPVPTGEGLVESFFELVPEEQPNGKTKEVKRKTKTAVHFSIDEGMALVSSGGRQGATVGSVLCAAWAGQNPGQANASADRRRIGMEPGTFRMSGVVGIQTSLGHELLSERHVQQGLAGRLVFFQTTHPAIPDRSRPLQQTLDLPVPDTYPLVIGYADEIWDEVQDHHVAVRRGLTTIAPIDGHRNLLRLKLAGILALMEGERSVALSHWLLATTIVSTSDTVRSSISIADRANSDARTLAQVRAEAHREDLVEAENVQRACAQIERILGTRSGRWSRKDIRIRLSSTPVRQQLDTALELLEATGKIEADTDGWKLR